MPSWKKITPEQAARFEAAVPDEPVIERRQMFGCPVAFVNGNMFTGVHNDEINVRLSDEDRARCLAEVRGARMFEPMKGMQMKEYVVLPSSVASDAGALAGWVRRGFAYASSLAPKKKKPAKKAKAKAKAKKR